MRSQYRYLPLFLILLLHVLGWIILKPVVPHADDFCYADYARSFFHEHFHITYNKFQNRFGVYIPVAILIQLFGDTPHVISLWPLLASCITIILVFIGVNKISGLLMASVSSFLIAVNVLQITYSIALFPDLIVSMYAIVTVLILYRGRMANNNLLHAIALPIVFLAGMFTKETMLLMMPFLMVVLVMDLIKKEHLVFWKRTMTYVITATIIFFGFYWVVTGDAFHRIKSMIDFRDNYLMTAEDEKNLRATFPNNIFVWLNGELGYVFILLFSLPAFFFLMKDRKSFQFYVCLYSLLLLVEYLFLFHTKKYGAIFLQDRIWMLLIAPLSIVGANTIVNGNRKVLIFLLVLFMAYTTINFPVVGVMRELFYLSFVVGLCVVLLFIQIKPAVRVAILLLPFLILFLNFVIGNSNYRLGSSLKEERTASISGSLFPNKSATVQQ